VDGLLQGLLIVGLVFWVGVAAAVMWARHRVRRHLRISPAVRSCAPTSYLVSPAAAARLHRRLRRIGATARLAVALDPALAPVADEVVAEALALERQVVATGRTGRVGTQPRRSLAARIAALEDVARRLSSVATDVVHPAAPTSTTGIAERLAAIDAARQELAEIELRTGLHLQH
jgi:hypothetical protein